MGQRARGVLGGHHLQAVALDLGALAFAAELQVTLLADLLGSFAGRLEPFAGVESISTESKSASVGACVEITIAIGFSCAPIALSIAV